MLTSNRLRRLLSPDFMIEKVNEVHGMIHRNVVHLPNNAFRTMFIRSNGRSKPLASIDHRAEEKFIDALTDEFGERNIFTIGEESLFEGVDFTNETRTCVLIDMVDVTDLLQRGLSNWCSAITVFDPQRRRILGAFVASPNDYLYFATDFRDHAYKKSLSASRKELSIRLHGRREGRRLEDASLCMYGQKGGSVLNMLALNQKPAFIEWLKEMNERERAYREGRTTEEVRFRFYNLAGNPLMVRLADGAFDLVIEPSGQQPHDMSAGAYIAVKAGCPIGDVEGQTLELRQIAEALLRPADTRVAYILAANDMLLAEIAPLDDW